MVKLFIFICSVIDMLQEFKKFAIKGNVVDLAIGVAIGAAFSAIVTSLVGDVIMPIIGALTGGVNFSGLVIDIGASHVAYGKFIQALFVFIIVAFALFMLMKGIMVLKKAEDEKPIDPPAPSPEEKLLTEIRDLLKK